MNLNALNLKVIKVKNEDNFHYFICKPKLLSNGYIEIFTGEKIVVKDKSCVDALSNYFSILGVNDKTSDSLMLSKQELLVEYVKLNNYLSQIEDNELGDKNYQMKDTYEADNLVVANLQCLSSNVTDFGPMVETTEQKYIFEIIYVEEQRKYREIFTGFIADDKEEFFDLPYVVSPVPFTDFFPETEGMELPKLSLIWTQNDINYPKKKLKEKRKKN